MNVNNNLTLNQSDVELSKLSLPLTTYIAQKNKNALKDYIILHINHALSDVYALNEIMVDTLGAKLFFISTPYNSTFFNSKKYDYLFIKRRGNSYKSYLNNKYVSTSAKNSSFMEVIHRSILFALEFIKRNYQHKKIIVLQDGGYTAATSNIFTTNDPFENLEGFIGMVEQTQGGTRLFKEKSKLKKLKYPVLTISRSLIKMRVESHFIAQRVLEEVNRSLYKMGYFLNFKSVILGGYGIIGRQLAKYLKGINARVRVVETNPQVKRLAESEGFKTISKISNYDISKSFCFIGVTGKCTFGIEELISFLESKNKYYFIASGSSKRYEFESLINYFESAEENAKTYIQKYPELRNVEKKRVIKKSNGVLLFTVRYHGIVKTIFVLAEGFPINLYANDIQSIPDRAIDPIQALLLTCVIKLSLNSSKLKTGLLNVSDIKVAKAIELNEEEMLSEWFYLNDITEYSSKPFRFFKPHPLEKLLVRS